jgi:hypothetical protein
VRPKLDNSLLVREIIVCCLASQLLTYSNYANREYNFPRGTTVRVCFHALNLGTTPNAQLFCLN